MQNLRSIMMSNVRTKNTGIELAVRRVAHRLGYRFRVNVEKMPGKPDVVFPRFKVALFIHGCFWHGHSCSKGKLPKTNSLFWKEKIDGNRSRDIRNRKALEHDGWRVFELWECEMKTETEIVSFLKDTLAD